ncbi:hypothetical protein KK120_18670 [Virgibacillus dakarensis]|nr:hypothetical protein [Virgibacillus dakarensis]
MKEQIRQILIDKFDYYNPKEELLHAIIDFDYIFEQLHPFEVKVLYLYTYEEVTFQDIADMKGCSKQYINKVYQRALNKIINY